MPIKDKVAEFRRVRSEIERLNREIRSPKNRERKDVLVDKWFDMVQPRSIMSLLEDIDALITHVETLEGTVVAIKELLEVPHE